MRGLFERGPGLLEDLRGDEAVIVGEDAPGVDDLEFPAVVLGLTVNAIARDAGFIPDNRPPVPNDRVE